MKNITIPEGMEATLRIIARSKGTMPKDFPVTVSGKVGKFLNDALTKFDYELGQIDPVVLLFVSDPKDSSFNGVKKVHQFAKMGNSDMSTEIVFE